MDTQDSGPTRSMLRARKLEDSANQGDKQDEATCPRA